MRISTAGFAKSEKVIVILLMIKIIIFPRRIYFPMQEINIVDYQTVRC